MQTIHNMLLMYEQESSIRRSSNLASADSEACTTDLMPAGIWFPENIAFQRHDALKLLFRIGWSDSSS